MNRVVLESPFAGDIEKHRAYAKACVKDCLSRGEAPIASHLLFTQPGILDDDKPEERKLGVAAGHAWTCKADKVVVYEDYGISTGMQKGISRAIQAGIQVEYRVLSEIPKSQRVPRRIYLPSTSDRSYLFIDTISDLWNFLCELSPKKEGAVEFVEVMTKKEQKK